ncbi:flagellar hook-basal body protein [Paenibacillus physcomitrellae]|uniref:Flagellar basal-body rod protein FlgG n=1 Tax=Paenibacillus physcomitrellae TaxID=1619311 RepID=A0ABQ1GHH6_9BACL|nr:flagellar hook-basal body protein [Paenibacillus physcomitrellae]GGA43958.1 flagellar basal-body rod protein FlgG [Paenibacillus physcomitrellae]
MNNSMISSMVSLGSLQQRLDLLADNIANLNTNGYKSKDASFVDTLTRVQQQAKDMTQLTGRSTPSGYNLGFGAKMSGLSLDFTQGEIKDTGLPTDLAIQGNALFRVRAADGSDAWTRVGDFQLHPDPANPGQAALVTSQGYSVLDTTGQPVSVPANSKLQIAADGTLTVTDATGTFDFGQLQLDYVNRPEGLVELTDNMYGLVSGAVQGDVLTAVDTLADGDPRLNKVSVRQGALEQSNVDLSKEMTDMLQVQRAYQLSARALTSSEAMMNMANHLRG